MYQRKNPLVQKYYLMVLIYILLLINVSMYQNI